MPLPTETVARNGNAGAHGKRRSRAAKPRERAASGGPAPRSAEEGGDAPTTHRPVPAGLLRSQPHLLQRGGRDPREAPARLRLQMVDVDRRPPPPSPLHPRPPPPPRASSLTSPPLGSTPVSSGTASTSAPASSGHGDDGGERPSAGRAPPMRQKNVKAQVYISYPFSPLWH
uniref:Uncharacterized protein n=1 Tax=Oryza nivara TaxID=4536 RepID=A0A0E0HFP3_ORYNI